MADEPTPRTRPGLSKTIGEQDKGSRAKAESASKRAGEQMKPLLDSEAWPRNPQGKPMMKVTMTASELIPTGQYANISVGPAQIVAFVDPERNLEESEGGEAYFSKAERATLAQALNEMAEIVEVDVIAVQRNLVMESMQKQLSS